MADEPNLTPPASADTSLLTDDTPQAPTPVEPTSAPAADDVADGVAPASDGADDTPAVGAPENYADFELPDGMALDADALGAATPLFKELGLTQEQAQKVVSMHADLIAKQSAAQGAAFAQQMEDWRGQTEKDAEFGGEKFNESLSTAKRALDQFGSPALKELLDSHGMGNHPEVFRLLWNVGKTLREDVPGATGGASAPQKSAVDILYPNDRKTA